MVTANIYIMDDYNKQMLTSISLLMQCFSESSIFLPFWFVKTFASPHFQGFSLSFHFCKVYENMMMQISKGAICAVVRWNKVKGLLVQTLFSLLHPMMRTSMPFGYKRLNVALTFLQEWPSIMYHIRLTTLQKIKNTCTRFVSCWGPFFSSTNPGVKTNIHIQLLCPQTIEYPKTFKKT